MKKLHDFMLCYHNNTTYNFWSKGKVYSLYHGLEEVPFKVLIQLYQKYLVDEKSKGLLFTWVSLVPSCQI